MQTVCIYNPWTAKIIEQVILSSNNMNTLEIAKIKLLMRCEFPCEVIAQISPPIDGGGVYFLPRQFAALLQKS